MSTPAAPNQGSSQGTPKKGKRGQPRQVQTFPADEFQVRKVTSVQEKTKYKRHRFERSAQQKAVDEMVWEAYGEWRDGTDHTPARPRKFVDMPLSVWAVSKNLEEDARHMLGKAAVLYQRTLRYGDCPDVVIDGKKKIELSFYVIDRDIEVEGAPD